MIGPAIPELKYVQKFRLIDGHGVFVKRMIPWAVDFL